MFLKNLEWPTYQTCLRKYFKLINNILLINQVCSYTEAILDSRCVDNIRIYNYYNRFRKGCVYNIYTVNRRTDKVKL